MPIIDDLVAFWPLNEASGDAIDAHGSNDLTETSGAIDAATGPGGVDGSRDFEGGDTEYFSINDNTDVSTGNIDFTFTGFMRLESLSLGTVLSQYHSSVNQRAYLIGYDTGSSRFRFAVSSNGTGGGAIGLVLADNLGAPSTGVWYFFVAEHDSVGNTLKIQIDNGTADSLSWSSGVHDSNQPFRLGSLATNAEYWDGLLAKIGFWKRILTADEKTWLYNGGTGRTYAEIVGGVGHPTRGRSGGVPYVTLHGPRQRAGHRGGIWGRTQNDVIVPRRLAA